MMGVRTSDGARVLIAHAHIGHAGEGIYTEILDHHTAQYTSAYYTSGYYSGEDGTGRYAPINSSPSTHQNDIYEAIGNNYDIDWIQSGSICCAGTSPRSISGMGSADETGSEDGYLVDDFDIEIDSVSYYDQSLTGAICDCNGSQDPGSGVTNGDSGAPVYGTNGDGTKHKLFGLMTICLSSCNSNSGFYGFADYAATARGAQGYAFAYCVNDSCSQYSDGD